MQYILTQDEYDNIKNIPTPTRNNDEIILKKQVINAQREFIKTLLRDGVDEKTNTLTITKEDFIAASKTFDSIILDNS